GVIHILHSRRVQAAYVFFQAGAVNGAHLLQQDNGVLVQPLKVAAQPDVGGDGAFAGSAGNGRRDHRGAVPVAHIVLDHQHRPDAALLGADDRRQVCVVNITFFNLHSAFSFPLHFMTQGRRRPFKLLFHAGTNSPV
ncbi:DUF4320 domain-containing protein, partial [Dysosmobacter welbionis]